MILYFLFSCRIWYEHHSTKRRKIARQLLFTCLYTCKSSVTVIQTRLCRMDIFPYAKYDSNNYTLEFDFNLFWTADEFVFRGLINLATLEFHSFEGCSSVEGCSQLNILLGQIHVFIHRNQLKLWECLRTSWESSADRKKRRELREILVCEW